MLRVTLTKGLVGKKDTHKKVIRALGLRKYGSSALHHDCPTIRGMVDKVHYLVTVTEEAGTEDSSQVKAAVKAKSIKALGQAPAKKADKPEAKATATAKPAAKAATKAAK